jgi:predicted transcriptional regulator
MKLKDYLEYCGLSVKTFTAESMLSLSVIYKVLHGKTIAPRSARRIKTVTKGRVGMDDMNVRKYISPYFLKDTSPPKRYW